VRGENPFAGVEHDLDYWQLQDETETLALIDEGLPAEDRQARFVAYAGLFDLLVEALWDRCDGDTERGRQLSRILSKFQSVEPTLRFSLFEKGKQVEGLELVSRMRGKDIAVTEEWLLPHLERDMGIYRARIVALQAALRESQG
jgi:hypothetical protein